MDFLIFFFSFLTERRIWCWRPLELWGGSNTLKMTKQQDRRHSVFSQHGALGCLPSGVIFFRLWSTFGRNSCTLLGSVLKDICRGTPQSWRPGIWSRKCVISGRHVHVIRRKTLLEEIQSRPSKEGWSRTDLSYLDQRGAKSPHILLMRDKRGNKGKAWFSLQCRGSVND